MQGVAHLGVLAEFEWAAVEVCAVAPTSSRAMLGALWLLNGTEPAIRPLRVFASERTGDDVPDLKGDRPWGVIPT